MANPVKQVNPTLQILSLIGLALLALALAGCSGLPAPANPLDQPAPAGLLNQASTPQLGQVLVTGLVTGVSSGQISVGDLTFRVDEQTQLPAGLQAGSQARVLAIRLPDNTHYALEVSPVPQTGQPAGQVTPGVSGSAVSNRPGEFQMYGLVQAVGSDNWQVSDMRFQVSPETNIQGNIQVGDVIKIEGTLSDSGMAAHEIDLVLGSVAPPSTNSQSAQGGSGSAVQSGHTGGENELYGVIEATGATWSISGTAFLVDASTQIDGKVAVGSSVQVHYVQQADGSFLATKIELDNEDENYASGGSHSGDDSHSLDTSGSTHENEPSDQQDHSSGDNHQGQDSGGSHESGGGHDD